MKIKVELIVARINGKVIFAEALNDCYDEVQVIVNKNDLDEESIECLSCVGWISIYDDAFNMQGEAKDSTGTYGNLVVAIETKEIELEDL